MCTLGALSFSFSTSFSPLFFAFLCSSVPLRDGDDVDAIGWLHTRLGPGVREQGGGLA